MPVFYSFLFTSFVMEKRFRIILDTNIYGLFFEKDESILKKAEETTKVTIYGFDVVRKELRDTSKKLKYGNRNFRGLLLGAYDRVVKKDYYLSPVIENIAEQYWREYGGGISKRKMWNDFLIVACSSIHDLDIIVSEDNDSMISRPAVKAYTAVNARNQLREPAFFSIEKFWKLL
ncbi:MAG: hypothetical protein QT03_C0001G0565 [archaeon GW2011_AR10]|nr:MAG: hypothetical protein QT03_C0001G0565 [archaeon GW2011_AR10]